ncbi:MAG: hypothetical protein HY926_05950 [Elusimicrobia bacterium]|nr:hypothetical protein [Elusimicrobiota bacterium]
MWTRERLAVLGQTATVAVITAATFLAFFLRDYLLMRADSTGYALDVFYTGMVVPTLFVNVLLVPLGTALVPHFVGSGLLRGGPGAWPELTRLVLRLSAVLATVALLLATLFGSYAQWIAPGFDAQKLAAVREVLLVGAAIMALGGSLIVLNAALNASGNQAVAALAQLAVAVVAVAAVLTLYPALGVMAAAWGMLAGQAVNLALLLFYLWGRGRAEPPSAAGPGLRLSAKALTLQYLPLVGASLLAGLTLPITNTLAAALPAGSVALFGFGYKVILFLTGVIATALTAVVVPYFASRHDTAKELAEHDTSFFLWVITLATLPVVMAVYGWADAAVAVILPWPAQAGGTAGMTRVIKIGIVQLPFFGVSVVLTRYLIAARRSAHVFFAATLSVAVLVVAGRLLESRFGLAGIAAATTLSAGVMSVYLLVVLSHAGQVSLPHLVSTLVFWMLFITMSVCLHYKSYTGIVICCFCILLLLAANRDAIRPWLRLNAASRPRF